MPDALVEIETADRIATIWLNRADKLNAVSDDLVEELLAAFDDTGSGDVDAIVLAGRGRAFCSGRDLAEAHAASLAPNTFGELRRLARLQEVTRAMQALPCCVVSAVHGYAVGAGAEIALSADLVLLAEDAIFRFPEVGLGRAVTGGMTALLVQTVGLLRAKQLLFVDTEIGARAAVDAGLANRVVARDELYEQARALAVHLGSLPQPATWIAKKSLNRGLGAAPDLLDWESYAAAIAASSPAAEAASARFAGKPR